MLRKTAFLPALALALGLVMGLATPAPGGALAQAQPAQQPPVEQTKNGDWIVACAQDPGSGRRACEMYQIVNRKETQRPFLSLFIGYLPGQREAKMRLLAHYEPLGIVVSDGITFQIDQATPQSLRFDACTPRGCAVEMDLNASLVNSMKRGNGGTIALRLVNGVRANVPFSLKGFTKSFDSIPVG